MRSSRACRRGARQERTLIQRAPLKAPSMSGSSASPSSLVAQLLQKKRLLLRLSMVVSCSTMIFQINGGHCRPKPALCSFAFRIACCIRRPGPSRQRPDAFPSPSTFLVAMLSRRLRPQRRSRRQQQQRVEEERRKRRSKSIQCRLSSSMQYLNSGSRRRRQQLLQPSNRLEVVVRTRATTTVMMRRARWMSSGSVYRVVRASVPK